MQSGRTDMGTTVPGIAAHHDARIVQAGYTPPVENTGLTDGNRTTTSPTDRPGRGYVAELERGWAANTSVTRGQSARNNGLLGGLGGASLGLVAAAVTGWMLANHGASARLVSTAAAGIIGGSAAIGAALGAHHFANDHVSARVSQPVDGGSLVRENPLLGHPERRAYLRDSYGIDSHRSTATVARAIMAEFDANADNVITEDEQVSPRGVDGHAFFAHKNNAEITLDAVTSIVATYANEHDEIVPTGITNRNGVELDLAFVNELNEAEYRHLAENFSASSASSPE